MNTRLLRAVHITGWTLIVLALVHLATEIATIVADPSAQMLAATTAMDGVAVPTSAHSLLVTTHGVSFAMALFLAATGAAIVLAARHGRSDPAVLRAILWFAVIVTALGLVISVATLPLPPIIGLGLACVVAVIGLLPGRSRTA